MSLVELGPGPGDEGQAAALPPSALVSCSHGLTAQVLTGDRKGPAGSPCPWWLSLGKGHSGTRSPQEPSESLSLSLLWLSTWKTLKQGSRSLSPAARQV